MFDIDQEKAKKIITSFQVPVKPKILTELQQEQAKPEPSPAAFAEVIVKDVALSAYILKTINSPIFGLNRTLTDIKQSVILLGCKNITNIVSFFQLRDSFKSSNTAISYERYWDTAMETANMMAALLGHINLQYDCPLEDAYSFGLFRDCGIPLMAMKYPDYKTCLIKANASPEIVFTEVENDFYQTNHAVVGYFVAKSWNLPASLCEMILRHHEPDFLDATDVTGEQKDLYVMAKIASNTLSQHKFGKDDSEWYLAKDPVLDYLGFSEHDYQDLEEDAKEEFRIQFG